MSAAISAMAASETPVKAMLPPGLTPKDVCEKVRVAGPPDLARLPLFAPSLSRDDDRVRRAPPSPLPVASRPSPSHPHRPFPPSFPPTPPPPPLPPLQMFASISSNDLLTFLACTADETRLPESRGTFSKTDWAVARERWRKYRVRYVFLRERDPAEAGEDTGSPHPSCDVTYLPQFGPVPGYREGAVFADEYGEKENVLVRCRKEKTEFGKPGEWRVCAVKWGNEPKW